MERGLKEKVLTVRSYMKAAGSEVGLILNFATMPLTVKRVGREFDERTRADLLGERVRRV